jgi:alkylation response protein AidB-like acyl-CoA dehydrogenase
LEGIAVTIDAITAARHLSPVIRELRHETEAERRLAAPIVERLRETRLCRMAVAKELAGLELPLVEMLEVYEVLAADDASVAWIVWNNALPCLFGRWLDGATRAEVFADPAWLYAVSTRPTGRASREGDRFRVDGRWTLVSGCELAEWLALTCVVEQDGEPLVTPLGEPETRLVFVRREDFQVLDTWHVSSLRGTGSHDVVVQGKRIAREHTVSPADPSTLEAPLGRVPIISAMAAGYAAQVLGLGRLAVDTLVALLGSKVAVDPRFVPRERPAVLSAIAREGAALEAARSHLRSCADRMWRAASAGRPATIHDITAVWSAALHAVDVAREAIDTMHAAGGTSSLYTDCPLERAHRDVHAMSRHLVAQEIWREDAGRVELGMSPTQPLYAV